MTKGALVEVKPAFGTMMMPNIVAFQFNPETLRHSWTQPPASTSGSHPLAARGNPAETFSFSLALDVTDQIALGVQDVQGADARLNGIYSRLAALEMLMFPVGAESPLSGAVPTTEGRAVPASQVPPVLFVWGEHRIVPVRVTSLSITEKLFDTFLNPTHADAQIELRVLTSEDLDPIEDGPLKQIVTAAYNYSQQRRTAGALFNVTAAAGSIDLPNIFGM